MANVYTRRLDTSAVWIEGNEPLDFLALSSPKVWLLEHKVHNFLWVLTHVE
jgi:hypothetical protein